MERPNFDLSIVYYGLFIVKYYTPTYPNLCISSKLEFFGDIMLLLENLVAPNAHAIVDTVLSWLSHRQHCTMRYRYTVYF